MYDYVIVGTGIIGLSVAWQLKRLSPDARILLLEKESATTRHQSGHNSGVIHSGIYYPPGSLKAQLCRAGNIATTAFCDEHDIHYRICGKLIVATDEAEKERLQGIHQRSLQNGVPSDWLDNRALRQAEPNIQGKAALYVPSTGIVSYPEICEKLKSLFLADGGEIWFSAKASKIDERPDAVTVETRKGSVSSRFLIVCAGLQADRLVKAAGITPDFVICPFRGEYFRLQASRNHLIKHLIYPVPEPGVPFLGVHLTLTIDGYITVGPNAVLALAREGYRKYQINPQELWRMVTHRGIRQVLKTHFKYGLKEQRNAWLPRFYLKEVQKYCPSLTLDDLAPYPAGVRAQAISHDGELIEDFRWLRTDRSLHVCNAPSPAATSALPIAKRILTEVRQLTKSRLEK